MESEWKGAGIGHIPYLYKLRITEESSTSKLLRSERQMDKLPQLNSQLTTSNKLNSS